MPKQIAKVDAATPAGSIHKRTGLPDDLMRFSFRHYTSCDKFSLPAGKDLAAYLPHLLERLKCLSSMRLSEFVSNHDKALRIHVLRWEQTTEHDGFAHLNEQMRECQPFQFCVSANEYGRVHGVLVDSVFYIVWLDPGHALYAGKR